VKPFEVRANGEVEVHQGYRAYEDAHSAAKGDDGATRAKSELTKAAENYLALRRHAIVRAELLAHPAIALRLAAAHMITGSPLWSVKPDSQRADKEATAKSVAASPAQAVLQAERDAVLDLLQLEKSHYGTLTRGNGDAFTGASLFARLLALPDEAVLRVIALAMTETLAAGSALTEAAGLAIKPDVTRWWKLDETFLDFLRDRAAINAMLSELAGQAVRTPMCPSPAGAEEDHSGLFERRRKGAHRALRALHGVSDWQLRRHQGARNCPDKRGN
jgi:ParB family chromosome partitioning protein